MNITRLRINAGISQMELGKRIGVTDSAICQYEKGKRVPNAIMLKKIANVLNCTVDDLLKDNETN